MLNDYLFFEMNKNISQSNKNNFDKVFGVNSKKIVEKKKILSATTNKFIEKQDFSQSLNINNAYNKANENNKEDRINNRIQSSKKSKIEIIDQVVNDGRKSSQMKSQKIDIEMKEKDENNNILINKEIKKDNKVLNEIINEIQKEIIVAKTNKIQKHEVCAQFNLNININQEKKIKNNDTLIKHIEIKTDQLENRVQIKEKKENLISNHSDLDSNHNEMNFSIKEDIETRKENHENIEKKVIQSN